MTDEGRTEQAGYRASHAAPDKGRQYDAYYRSDRWNAFLWGREQEILERVLARECPSQSCTVLDFACGTGRVSAFLEGRVGHLVGVDVSDPMISEAREKVPSAELILGDIVSDPSVLGERDFQLITAFRFFVNAEPQLRRDAMAALTRHLDPQGAIVFNIHHHIGSPYVRLVRAVERRRNRPYNWMSLAQTHALCESAGLELRAVHPAGVAHIPKVHVPERVLRPLDRAACAMPLAYRVAEDLICVARHAPHG